MEDYHIKEASQKNLTCYGWDAINHRAGEEDLSGVCRFVCKPEPNGSSTITVDDNWEERFPKKLSSEVALSLKIAAAQELWRRESSEEVMNMPPLKRRKLESDNECLINECFEDIANSVQPRTQALIETLRKIENLRTQGKITGKIFLIAGTYHLVEHFHDPRLSLQPLYKELEKLPSVVLVRK
jgi:hypothetical protein